MSHDYEDLTPSRSPSVDHMHQGVGKKIPHYQNLENGGHYEALKFDEDSGTNGGTSCDSLATVDGVSQDGMPSQWRYQESRQ